MTSAWTHEQLQRAIYEEVAALAYVETRTAPGSSEVDEEVPCPLCRTCRRSW
jgi:hypothetical protein